MALAKEKKVQIVADLKERLDSSKMTVFAHYQGTAVSVLAELRRSAADEGVSVRVVKNRLFKRAMDTNPHFKSLDKDVLSGQLLYAFGNDEVAPAKVLASFAKSQPQLKFAGALAAEGYFLSVDDVTVLANLPTKQELRAKLASTLKAPFRSLAVVAGSSGRNLLSVLSSRSQAIS